MKFLQLILALFSIAIIGCASNSGPGPRPAQLQANYPNLLDKPVIERLGVIPQVLIDDLRAMDSQATYKTYVLTPKERIIFESTVAQLPGFLLGTLQKEVYAIYFVENFAGGGMTYYLWKDGKPKYILIFNPKTLKLSLSDWLTYRDNTAFNSSNSVFSLRESESGNHIGFLHTLIHESCHIYDFTHSVTGTSYMKLSPVAAQVWIDQKNVLPKHDFSTRSKLSFYDFENKPKVPISDFVSEFDAFTASGFASVYGSWNPLEEFAENETYILLDRNFSAKVTLEIRKEGKSFEVFVPSESPVVLGRNVQFMDGGLKN